jgi:hypothetical protein
MRILRTYPIALIVAVLCLSATATCTISRKPNFVLTYGQVHNPTAITYVPGKTVEWYLQRAGWAY